MRAVVRLVWTYFTATPLMLGLSVTGLAFVLAGVAGHLVVPGSEILVLMRGNWEWSAKIFIVLLSVGLPWLGFMLLLASTVLLPSIVERIALGRSVWVLPGGRIKLLTSSVVSTSLLALLVASGATVGFLDYFPGADYGRIFYRTLLMAFIDIGVIYVAIWLVGKTRGVWRLVGTLWVIVSITLPLRYLGGIPPFSPLEGIGLAIWLVFAALLLCGGRARHAFHGLKARVAGIARAAMPTARYKTGREHDLMLGTAHPWIVALGQIIPIAVMVALIRQRSIWLVVLIIFSALAGAVTSQAASRSRRIWLTFDGSRIQVFHRVERAFWRYNASSLAVLLAVYAALATYAGFAPILIAHGLFLLALGCAACTYLGFMITRGLGWFESILCILTLMALAIAAIATMHRYFVVAVELEVLLAVLAIAFRYAALSRWAHLDWMRCRAEIEARAAG